jgi:hypothetical protein
MLNGRESPSGRREASGVGNGRAAQGARAGRRRTEPFAGAERGAGCTSTRATASMSMWMSKAKADVTTRCRPQVANPDQLRTNRMRCS